ncbi:MAG: ABC transporter permease [Chthoniobacter sp.]|nr:ABC transporter permease [Chthoniobacter sp.]
MAEVAAPQNIEIVIQPSRGWMNIPWREIWEYRDLLYVLVQRDFISRYKQTILGPLWHLLQPVITAAVFAVVFGGIAGIPTDGIPKLLFYLCGLLGWSYFSQNITNAGATFVNNAHLFGKVYFPRLIVPISIIVSNLIAFALQLIPFVICFVFYKFFTKQGDGIELTWRLLLAPLPLLHTALLSFGVSLWMSASTAKYRDLIHLNQYIIQIWMFATPIFYPLSRVSPKFEWAIWANPMSVPVESFRICLLGHGRLGTTEIVISVVTTLLLTVTGVIAFQKVERTVVDSV